MEKNDWLILLFGFFIFLSLCLVLIKINTFMPVVESCEDDFSMIEKCGCVPCSWKNAEQINKKPCFTINSSLLHG